MTTATSTIETLLTRSACYHALSVVLRHPDADTMQWLVLREHHRLRDVVEALAGERDGTLCASVRRLVTALDATPAAEWSQEYERIFGHSVQSAAPPYELEYGEEHSHRQPQELGDIAAFYQAFGLQVAPAAHERADHVGVECDFLQYLLYKAAVALDDHLAEQAQVCHAAAQRFLVDHLGRWGPAFAVRLRRVAHDGVLAAAADALLAWLTSEAQHLELSLGSQDLPLRAAVEAEPAGCAACSLQPKDDTGTSDGMPR